MCRANKTTTTWGATLLNYLLVMAMEAGERGLAASGVTASGASALACACMSGPAPLAALLPSISGACGVPRGAAVARPLLANMLAAAVRGAHCTGSAGAGWPAGAAGSATCCCCSHVEAWPAAEPSRPCGCICAISRRHGGCRGWSVRVGRATRPSAARSPRQIRSRFPGTNYCLTSRNTLPPPVCIGTYHTSIAGM
jgi:hypothetical protein